MLIVRLSPAASLTLGTIVLAVAACGDSGGNSSGDPTGPAFGSIAVTTTTAGSPVDPDGYTVAIDDAPGQAIGINASSGLSQVAPGEHTVRLSGMAANCTVADNPRPVEVTTGGTTEVVFSISCASTTSPIDTTGPTDTTGAITVTTTTTGPIPDPNRFAVAVDGSATQAIGVNHTLTISGLAAGSHTVVLSGVAANCTVSDGASRRVSVTSGGTTSVIFAISCTAPTGTLEVTTVTTGENLDPDGYRVAVDGGAARQIGIADTLTIPNLAPGNHRLRLSAVADNCTVTDNGRTVTVTAGATAQVSFAVACTASPTSTTPTLSNVQAPDMVTNAPGDSSRVRFDFADSDGNILAANLEIVSDPHGVYSGNGYFPGDTVIILMDAAGDTEGSDGIFLGCPRTACFLGTGPVTLALSVLDAAGNRSRWVEFSFEVVEATSTAALRSQRRSTVPRHPRG